MIALCAATSASSVMSVCTGAQLCLHWTACLNSPDVISQVLWFHQDTPPLLIAVATDGQIVSTAAFTGRVQQTTNAGITLHDLTTSDAGNYSVEVWVEKEDGSIDIWTASVYVLVTGIVAGHWYQPLVLSMFGVTVLGSVFGSLSLDSSLAQCSRMTVLVSLFCGHCLWLIVFE